MKTIWIAGALLAASVGAAAQDSTRYVRSAVVNLRSAADRNASVLARLRINTPLQLQGPEGGEFCAVKPLKGSAQPGFVACALLAPRETSAEQLAAELKPVIDSYARVLAQRGNPEPLDAASRRLIVDPREALGLLEKQFYLRPSIDTLAWYGGLAEDMAYLGTQPGTDGANSPALSPRAEWLGAVRTTWRAMTAYLEQGWAADDRWPRLNGYRYELASNLGDLQLVASWLPAVKPSLWRDDAELYAVSGEPLSKRVLLRGQAGGTAGATYQAETSSTLMRDEAPPNTAGGFRSVGPLLEFLKGQPAPPKLKFAHRGSYGIDGLLGTVGAELQTPEGASLVWAVGRDGLAPALQLQLQARHMNCGANEGVRVTLAAPRKTTPLAYVASLRPLDAARAVVTPLGTTSAQARESDGVPPRRYQGWRFDLDGDGQPDLVVVQGRGKAFLPTSGIYAPSEADDDELLNVVWANIGGQWKQVAYAHEGGCT